ncbi:GNAT family N-acetyltransferase [Vibrio quintilis]|uniref:Aminoglycoside N(6')-acetyltransferase type 1 n=1 Tax=Vibrio quintilis TaxID=1117707 RepID=A0A1M7Z2C0_9VIBR|nr:GNAT family N-acetyltransferase [Vibrio quintilis]SHO59043.1 Aminoglycoside N(6')-acetyltransferase type 1 [Vibrio quintilis]
MPTTKIRFARTEDLVQLEKMMYDLHDEHHIACPEHFKTAQEVLQEKQINDYLDSPEALIFIACHENIIVGFITGHFAELISMVSKPVLMGSIDELFVSPAFRSRGIGRKLLDRLIREFEDYGIEQIFVEVWAFNQSAQKLYQQLGFDHHIHWLRKSVK